MIGRCLWAGALALSVMAAPSGRWTEAQSGAVRAVPQGAPVLTAGSGTVTLRGSLQSTLDVTMRGAFSVGHARNLSWDLLRLEGMTVSGYREAVVSETFSFNVKPDSFQDLTNDGMSIRRFFWSQPPANTVITVSVHHVLRVTSKLSKFQSGASYPLASLPEEVQPYMQVTPTLKLTAAQRAAVRRIAGKAASEAAVVRKIANWVGSHVRYDASLINGPYDASWVMTNRRATCQGYSNLMAAMLRVVGIPSQAVYGWVSSAPVIVKSGRTTASIEWAQRSTPGTFHDWLNVYFPGSGWVAFDPQREKSFVDTRHYAFLTQVDATDPDLGQWSADVGPGQSATGRNLPNGTTEAVPSDGSYTPTAHERDAFSLHAVSVVHDVRSVTLFAR